MERAWLGGLSGGSLGHSWWPLQLQCLLLRNSVAEDIKGTMFKNVQTCSEAAIHYRISIFVDGGSLSTPMRSPMTQTEIKIVIKPI
jgi:hypothetical protein